MKIKKKTQQSKVTVTYFVFTSPTLLKCQYLEKTWMYFVQIWPQWSLIGTISYLCKLTIQDGRDRGDSNEYTQYTIFNMNKKNTLNYPKSAAMGFFSKGRKSSKQPW